MDYRKAYLDAVRQRNALVERVKLLEAENARLRDELALAEGRYEDVEGETLQTIADYRQQREAWAKMHDDLYGDNT